MIQMYSPDVIAKRIHLTEREFGFRLHRFERDESLYFADKIERKYDPKRKTYLNLQPDEQRFIRNEILLSRCDYVYWTRYARILLDDETGEEGPLKLWSAQARLIRKVGEVEAQMWKFKEEGRKRLDGNCWFVHKRRQTGASTVCQTMGVHRTALWSNMNGLTAGIDETSTLVKLYEKYYYFTLERLPQWMQPTRTSDNNQGIAFSNGSSVILQNSTGPNVGQGSKWHWGHLTECASWDRNHVKDQIENHFTNAISASIKGMAFLESTSQGIDDWWHHATELVRRGAMDRWHYFFVPWYAIEEISIDYPPEGWEPSPATKRHAESVERTSPEFMDGQTYRLTPGQMYFWERKHQAADISGSLAEFFMNYPSTPEESFVSKGNMSFPIQVLNWHDENTREPYAYYDILGPETPSELVITTPQRRPDGSLVHPPRIQKFGNIEIGPVWTTEDERKHPLGLIRVFENPDEMRKHDTYAACDTADGIAHWTRFIHKRSDEMLDRAAIEIFRQSRLRDGSVIDVQVGEFYAPISPIATAPYVVALSMLMHGRNAIEQQPPLMIELTGGGKTLKEELENRYGWMHFYQDFKSDGMGLVETDKFGWTPTTTSVRQMWTKGKQYLVDIKPACPKCNNRNIRPPSTINGRSSCDACKLADFIPTKVGRVILRSKPLVNEMRVCQDDAIYMSILTRFSRGKAKEGSGQHDDLVYASMFNLWQANLWNLTPAGTTTAPVHMTVASTPGVPMSARDMTPEERSEFWASWDERVMQGWSPYFNS